MTGELSVESNRNDRPLYSLLLKALLDIPDFSKWRLADYKRIRMVWVSGGFLQKAVLHPYMSYDFYTNYLKTIKWGRETFQKPCTYPQIRQISAFALFGLNSFWLGQGIKGKSRLSWPSVVGSCLVIKFHISQKFLCHMAGTLCIKSNQTLHCLKTLRMYRSQGSSCYLQPKSKNQNTCPRNYWAEIFFGRNGSGYRFWPGFSYWLGCS